MTGVDFGPANATGHITNEKCPLCGARLYTDGMHMWCSRVGEKHCCSYGVYRLAYCTHPAAKAMQLQEVSVCL